MNHKLTQLPIQDLDHIDLQEEQNNLHNTFDILYILSGRCRITCNAPMSTYTAGDILFVEPHTPYTISPDGGCTLLCLRLHAAFVYQNLGNYGNVICDSVREPNRDYTVIKELIMSISAGYLENAEKNRLEIFGFLYRLLAWLKEENQVSETVTSDIPQKYQDRIHTIIEYIDKHYAQPLTLSSLADALFLSPQYLSRFFKKYFHKNFKEYLLEKRLYHAYRDVCYTDESVTEIALRHGFSDTTAFTRAFRIHYGDSPGKFRKKMQSDTLKELYTHVEKHPVPDLTDSAGKPLYQQQVYADTACTRPFPKNFSALINIGSVQNLLMGDFCRQLVDSKKNLHFQYIRVHGITSSSFIPKLLPTYEYYFRNLDHVLDFMYDHDLIPFIELSRLPLDQSGFYTASLEISSVSRNRRFYEVLEAICRHCALRYPASWLSKWKFELWKPPTDEPLRYVKDFGRIQHMIHNFLPGATLGGFGFESYTDHQDLLEMLNCFEEFSVAPDFFSARFSLWNKQEKGNPSLLVSTDPDIMIKELEDIRTLLDNYRKGIPFYITEWNSVFIPGFPIQYSCFQSAFICKTILDLSGMCDLMGYWIYNDADPLFQDARSDSLYFWGQGLINKDHLRMPAFHAFDLLNRLGNQIIEKGKNFCITKSGENHYQIFAFRYAHFSSSFAIKQEYEAHFADTYQMFSNADPVQMEFTLNNMKPGTYRISRYLLDRAHGSILDIWIGGFASSNIEEIDYLMNIKLPAPEALTYYQRACIPEYRTIYLEAENSITVTSTLFSHNVCLWDITRLF